MINIVLFVVGALFGAILTFFICKNSSKNQNETEKQLAIQMQSAQQDLYEKMKLEFENITNRISKETSQEFSKNSSERIDELLKPFKEKMEFYQKQVNENNQKFGALDKQIENVIHSGAIIAKSADNLATSLKGDNKTQGKWGELILSRTLELSGLREGEEFVVQKMSAASKRPDATVFLPDNKAVFIDAKTTLTSYDEYINAEDATQKEYYLKMFKDSVKTHITNLAKREYFDTDEFATPAYVLMFIPIESCYSMLFLQDAALWEYAWKNNIMPTSPSTLLAALKIINSFNIVKRQNNNALEIAATAGKMLDKFAEFSKDLNNLHKNFKDALTKLDGKGGLQSQIVKLQELGAKTEKQIVQLTTIQEE